LASSQGVSGYFKQPGGTHAAAYTHGDNHVLHPAALTLDQGVADHARPAHAVGMADGDGAAVDVELVVVDAQLVPAVQLSLLFILPP
jgi:hypothetical protein